MSKTQIILIAITILLLVIGLWPVALLTAGSAVAIAIHNNETKRKTEKEELEQLKKKVEALEKEAYINSLVDKSDRK